MGLGDMFEGFLFKIALKKGVKAAVGVVAAATAANGALAQAGVSVDITKVETTLMALGTAAVTMFLNWAKVKTKIGAKLL